MSLMNLCEQVALESMLVTDSERAKHHSKQLAAAKIYRHLDDLKSKNTETRNAAAAFFKDTMELQFWCDAAGLEIGARALVKIIQSRGVDLAWMRRGNGSGKRYSNEEFAEMRRRFEYCMHMGFSTKECAEFIGLNKDNLSRYAAKVGLGKEWNAGKGKRIAVAKLEQIRSRPQTSQQRQCPSA